MLLDYILAASEATVKQINRGVIHLERAASHLLSETTVGSGIIIPVKLFNAILI